MHGSSRPAACKSLPTASTFSLRLADRNYEDPMPSQKEPAQAVAEIDYTVESANRLAEELRAIPPKDPAKRKLDKQGMVSLLAGELLALQQRGYTIEEVAEGLRGARSHHHDADPQELPPARQEQDGEASEERRPGPRPAGQAAGRQRRRSARRRTCPRPPQLRRHQPQSRRRARRRRARRRRLRRSGAARERFS